MGKSKKLIIFGLGDLAEIANEYYEVDSDYEVVAFTVDRNYLPERLEFCGKPVVPFEEIEKFYSPEIHEMHCALVYMKLNRCRADVCARAKEKGYKLASYISSHAFVSPSAKIGEHAFIFEGNVIQPFVEVGNNAILWSSNHCGHGSRIGNNTFISSHVVISGWCNIGDNTFIGVNSTLANNTKIGKECWIQHGSVISGKVPEHSFVAGSEISPLNEEALFRALKRSSENRK